MAKLPAVVARFAATLPASLPEGRVFVVLAPFTWGKAPTFEKAHARALENRARIYEGKLGWRAIVFDAPRDAYVDDMGGLRWDIPKGVDGTTIEAKELGRFGKFNPHD